MIQNMPKDLSTICLKCLDKNPAKRYPDFVSIAKGFGCGSRFVKEKSELVDALREMIDYPGPYLLNVKVTPDENVYPMVPAGGAIYEMVFAPETPVNMPDLVQSA